MVKCVHSTWKSDRYKNTALDKKKKLILHHNHSQHTIFYFNSPQISSEEYSMQGNIWHKPFKHNTTKFDRVVGKLKTRRLPSCVIHVTLLRVHSDFL